MTEVNPLREGLALERLPEPCTMVIFGASGDLTKRKLVPALYSLARDRLLPPSMAVVGFARRPLGDDGFRAAMQEGVGKFARRRPIDPLLWQTFASGISYHQGQFDEVESYRALGRRLEEIDRERGIPGNRLFYLSTPPSDFPTILENLGAAGLIRRGSDRPFTRIIIEKPFGKDLDSARELNRRVLEVADERQIYRIDHYLGKETVQNLMVFRFANAIFEPLWNSRFVDHVQITGAESIGIEGRGNYFEMAGILRDMVQNHLFQILSLIAMEPPVSMSADDLRDEKVKVLKALRPIGEADMEREIVRAQYREGSIGGKPLIGYHAEPGVAPHSVTETYVAMRFFIDSWRWGGVPFYLRSAKAMPKKVTEVALVFKEAPLALFDGKGPSRATPLADARNRRQVAVSSGRTPNVLAIRIQPDEGISLSFGSKLPGPENVIHPVNMEFRYGSSFGVEPPEAYERLLLDCLLGDASLFTRGDEVEASWQWISRVHWHWKQQGQRPIPSHEAGTWGPPEADDLMARDGRAWRRP